MRAFLFHPIIILESGGILTGALRGVDKLTKREYVIAKTKEDVIKSIIQQYKDDPYIDIEKATIIVTNLGEVEVTNNPINFIGEK